MSAANSERLKNSGNLNCVSRSERINIEADKALVSRNDSSLSVRSLHTQGPLTHHSDLRRTPRFLDVERPNVGFSSNSSRNRRYFPPMSSMTTVAS